MAPQELLLKRLPLSHLQGAPFNIQEWIQTVDIWDQKYDYVMHDDHWLTSKWSPDCEQCQAKKTSEPITPRAPPVTIAMTPIAPINASTRAFVTPYTATKYGNETFNRTTRQSARKLMNQNATQDLIDLNETFDLYRSALADSPQIKEIQPPAASKIPKIPVRLSQRPMESQTTQAQRF